MVYETIPIYLGSELHPLYTLNNQGPFFHCSFGLYSLPLLIYPRIDVFMYCQPTTTFNWNNLQIRVCIGLFLGCNKNRGFFNLCKPKTPSNKQIWTNTPYPIHLWQVLSAVIPKPNFTCLSHHFFAEGKKNSKLCDSYLMIRKTTVGQTFVPPQTWFFWWVISIPLMKESVSTIITFDKHIRIITFPGVYLPVKVPPPPPM